MSVVNETPVQLAVACQHGDRRAASRLISLLESPQSARAASEAVSHFPLPRQTIGLTGPPGAGKSTLLDYAVGLYRARNATVGVLAVDPSSPFTGGALLGDRIRMASLRNDPGVFIRSMGSRGASGGMAAAVSDSLRVLGANGYDIVFIETVGAGQVETEIVNLADTVCVIQVPGLGDDIQLMKMGVLEIADIFVVNKGDKPEAQELKLQLELALEDNAGERCRALRQLGKGFAHSYSGLPWTPPVILLSALQSNNGEELMAACDKHLEFLQQPALSAALKYDRIKRELLWRAGRRFEERLAPQLEPGAGLGTLVEACQRGEFSLEQAVEKMLEFRSL